MVKLIFKFSTLISFILFPSVPSKYRYFIRYYFISKFVQVKFFFYDYVLKKPYKKIEYNSEFSPELKFVLPFAYWHYKNGTLERTIGSVGTKELYFFSPNHVEEYDKRVWVDFNYNIEIPNSVDHNLLYDYTKWEKVPLKEQYVNNKIVFDKPILVIANKYNIEWGQDPVNFLDLEMIKFICEFCQDRYQIIYNRPSPFHIVNDESRILELGEKRCIKEIFPSVIFMEELYEEFFKEVKSFNHLQLLVYANASSFISVHGGTSTLASYFGGKNLIFSPKGHEHYFKEFQTIYPKLSGTRIIHAANKNDFKAFLKEHF
jgi:hypothetical protein